MIERVAGHAARRQHQIERALVEALHQILGQGLVEFEADFLLKMDVNPIWLAVLIGVNLQTSYLTPPFGFSLFFLRGVAPPEVTTGDIYRGIVPYVVLQVVGLAVVWAYQLLATWLPKVVYG